jgi:integrase
MSSTYNSGVKFRLNLMNQSGSRMGRIASYPTSGGKRYRVRYRKPDHSQTDKRGFRTKREAELFLAAMDISMAKGEFIDSTAGKVTVGELGAVWVRSQTQLKPSTLRVVETAWRLHVEPRWGALTIGQVRHSDVQTWVSELATRKSATTVTRAYGVLGSILDVAVRDRRLSNNVARRVNLPRKVPKARVYLRHAQVENLAEQSKAFGTLVRFLAYTGLRWGEAVGLRVGDGDTLRRRVTVAVNAVNVGGRIIVGTPKTHTTRSVPYPAFLTESLAMECEGKARDQLLFGDGINHLRSPDTRDGWYVNAKARAATIDANFPLNLTLHDLRHTAASLAISSGANVKAVQRMLGHASAAMTLDTYADLFDDDLDAVAAALDKARSSSIVGRMWANGPEVRRPIAELPRKIRGVATTSAVPREGFEPSLGRF